MNRPWCANRTWWDGSHQCMFTMPEGDDFYPKCETFFQIANKDANLWPRVFRTLHSSLSKENSEYQHDCTHIFPHLANLLRKHKTCFHLPNNSWKKPISSWTCRFSKLTWQSTWLRANIEGYSSLFYSLEGFCTCLEPPKYSTYFDVIPLATRLPLWLHKWEIVV